MTRHVIADKKTESKIFIYCKHLASQLFISPICACVMEIWCLVIFVFCNGCNDRLTLSAVCSKQLCFLNSEEQVQRQYTHFLICYKHCFILVKCKFADIYSSM